MKTEVVRKVIQINPQDQDIVNEYFKREYENGCRYSAIQAFINDPSIPNYVIEKLAMSHVEMATEAEKYIQELIKKYVPSDCKETVQWRLDPENLTLTHCGVYEVNEDV